MRGAAVFVIMLGVGTLVIAGALFAARERMATQPNPIRTPAHTPSAMPTPYEDRHTPSSWRAHQTPGGPVIPVPAGWRVLDYTWITETGAMCPAVQVLSPDGTASLFIEVECGSAEGLPNQCPRGHTIVHRRGDAHLVRYPASETEYRYTQGGYASVARGDTMATEFMCAYPASIRVPSRGATHVVYVRATLHRMDHLPTLDHIVWMMWLEVNP